MNYFYNVLLFFVVLSLNATTLEAGTPTATEFTYQGFLKDGGNPAQGRFDLEFTLWNTEAGGTQIGPDVFLPGVPAIEGAFQVQLDFGAAAFDGTLRWLRIRVAPEGGALTTLSPRQRVTAAPMAMYALQSPGGGGGGGTLDAAYDFGGPGVGRQITADAGAVHVLGNGGVQTDAGMIAPGAWIGRTDGVLDIQARHTFSLQGDPPAPATVRSYIVDGSPFNQEPKWFYLRAAPEGNSMRRHQGSSLLFQTETEPGSVLSTQMALTGSGNLGLGTILPASRLHITGGTDATLGGGGFFITGATTSTNLIMDDNEIMARNNGQPSTLFLNADGGDVLFGDQRTQPFFAYGIVSSNGTLVSGSVKVADATRLTEGRYQVSLEGGFDPGTDIALVTPNGFFISQIQPLQSAIGPSNGQLGVAIGFGDDFFVDHAFYFIVIRP